MQPSIQQLIEEIKSKRVFRRDRKRAGLDCKHETFGERNAVERFFSLLKGRTKRFWNRFPFRSSFDSVQSWLESFVAIYNVEMLFLAVHNLATELA